MRRPDTVSRSAAGVISWTPQSLPFPTAMAPRDPKSRHRLPLCPHAPLQYLTICYCFPQTHGPVAPRGPPLTTMGPTGPTDPPWICPRGHGSCSSHSSSVGPVYPLVPLGSHLHPHHRPRATWTSCRLSQGKPTPILLL